MRSHDRSYDRLYDRSYDRSYERSNEAEFQRSHEAAKCHTFLSNSIKEAFAK